MSEPNMQANNNETGGGWNTAQDANAGANTGWTGGAPQD